MTVGESVTGPAWRFVASALGCTARTARRRTPGVPAPPHTAAAPPGACYVASDRRFRARFMVPDTKIKSQPTYETTGPRLARLPEPVPPPAWLVAEPGGQALVVRAEVLLQRSPHGLGHRRARAGVVAAEQGMTAAGQAKEVQDLVVDGAGVGEEVAAVDDVDPVAAEDPLQALELVGVLPASAVGVVPVAVANVDRIGQHSLHLALEPGTLEFQGPRERLILTAAAHPVGMRGVGPLHRITQQDQQLHAGQVAVDPLGSTGVEHVAGARLEGYRCCPGAPRGQPGPRGGREVALIPGKPAIVIVVEVVNFLGPGQQGGIEHGRVLAERFEHGSGAAPRCAGDQEAGQHPRPVSGSPCRHQDGAGGPRDGRRQGIATAGELLAIWLRRAAVPAPCPAVASGAGYRPIAEAHGINAPREKKIVGSALNNRRSPFSRLVLLG